MTPGPLHVRVFAEHSGGEPERVTLELLGEARRLTRGTGGNVTALVLGDRVDALLEPLAHHGADALAVIEDPRLGCYDPELFAESVGRLCEQGAPALLLVPATSIGEDLAARLAVSRDWPLASRCVDFRLRGETLEMIRPIAGGTIHAVLRSRRSHRCVATVAPDVMGRPPADPGRTAQVLRAPATSPEQRRIEVRAFVRGDPARLDLGEAEVVVSAGRGIGSRQNMRRVHELAEVVGGSVGGTRAVADLGWVERSRQIGQTGKTVRPRLYVACGLSGAPQHTVGMKESRFVLAVNTDPAAPIFKRADLGLVADVNQLLPVLTERCRSEQEKP